MPNHHVFWHNYNKRYRMLCGPSRLVWFAVGGVATYAWMRHHRDLDHGHAGGFCRPRLEQRAQSQWERDGAHPPLPPPPPPPGASPPADYGEWRQTREWRPAQQGATSAGAGAGAPNPSAHVVPPGGAARQQEESLPMVTDRDYERLRQMGRSAEETISGMSEATIDSMMIGLQRLKDRLAERRGQETGSQQVNPTPAISPEEPPPRHRV